MKTFLIMLTGFSLLLVWLLLRFSMTPEGDAELPDDGLPDEQPEDEDCKPQDLLRMRQEDLGQTD